ncbi:MAG TPA: hypothetical protein ENN80_13295 [Candidatus Hydrogenedentes bacterium]|nr:hypothetical protein [Candidatus Hydrogenedentota bacterium]
MQTKRVLLRFLLFALAGMLMEVFFTAAGALIHDGNWNMHGHSSPWMMMDYGLLGIVLMPIARPLIRRGVALPFRAAVYMAGIFFVEFVSGWVFDVCGLVIWDYSHLPLNLCGYITLLYIPCWYATGLVVEYLYRRFDAFALVLAAGVSPEELEPLVNNGGR